MAPSSPKVGLDGERVAVGRIEGEARAIQVERTERRRNGIPSRIWGGVGTGGDLGGSGIDVERRTHDDVAEVIRDR